MSHGSETRKTRGGQTGARGRRSRERNWIDQEEDNESTSKPYIMPRTKSIEKESERAKLIRKVEAKGIRLRTDYTSLINNGQW